MRRLFEAVGRPRWLAVTGATTVLLYLAMIPSFVSLPFHLEIMRRYRTRGSLRTTSWWGESVGSRTACSGGQHVLDEEKGRAN